MYNQPLNNYYPQASYFPQQTYPNYTYQNMQNKIPQTSTDNKQQNSINLVYVNGYDSAKDVILQPNQRVWIMNTNANEFYIKTSDSMGVSTLDCYEFSKIDPKARENNVLNKNVDYIKREEFDALKSKIDALEKSFNQKPRTTKKAEE